MVRVNFRVWGSDFCPVPLDGWVGGGGQEMGVRTPFPLHPPPPFFQQPNKYTFRTARSKFKVQNNAM